MNRDDSNGDNSHDSDSTNDDSDGDEGNDAMVTLPAVIAVVAKMMAIEISRNSPAFTAIESRRSRSSDFNES